MPLQNTMKALADPTRRTILNLLKISRLSSGEIAENFDMSLPAVSKHLTILKDADLVRDYREGKYIFYELNASVLDEAHYFCQSCLIQYLFTIILHGKWIDLEASTSFSS